ncbi:hypothetical protein L596_005325 [Steinernema carpocapsae]|uniref:Uncharacterized protein n=1 Tax=Steinernema carpocapsae TaxID=34508 RepID=A0A4U8V331_STECR|nr:hypothetical protein L596_005325 [Steinernema carpocapsae]
MTRLRECVNCLNTHANMRVRFVNSTSLRGQRNPNSRHFDPFNLRTQWFRALASLENSFGSLLCFRGTVD